MTATTQARLFAATIVSVMLYAAIGWFYGTCMLPVAVSVWGAFHE